MKILKTFGLIAFVAVLGLGLFTSCEEPATLFDAASGEQSLVKITGLTDYNDKWVAGGIDSEPAGVFIATKISNGEVLLKLINSDSKKAGYAEGYFTVIIWISETQAAANNGKVTEYEGAALTVDIGKGKETTVKFSDFVEIKDE